MKSLCLFVVLFCAHTAWASPMRVDANGFLDPQGRRTLLRGFNVAGDAKVPPFRHGLEEHDYKRLAAWGVNVVRLLWIWEAFEPRKGEYHQEYLEDVRQQIRRAHGFGIHVIVDIHQDGFSRFLIGGCGDGFPQWVIPEWIKSAEPNNADRCQSWGARMAFDLDMHRAWHAFYGNHNQVRERFLAMVDHVANQFKDEPNILGYDLLNEPWGTASELKALWEDSARAIRTHDPAALIFVSPHAVTSTGIGFNHQIPQIPQAVYSPHYYDPIVLAGKHYLRQSLIPTMTRLKEEARKWGMPLFLGEFGFSPSIGRGGAFRRDIYGALDHTFTSAAQWNYTPRWTEERKDGWNLEDFSIVDQNGSRRTNFVARPYPQATSGEPISLSVHEEAEPDSTWFVYQWQNDPTKGSTEIYVGDCHTYQITTSPELDCREKGLFVSCTSFRRGPVKLELTKKISSLCVTD